MKATENRMHGVNRQFSDQAVVRASCSLPETPGIGQNLSAGCGCAWGEQAATLPLARYDQNGECESPWQISCETKWRIRECFKVAFCDLLRCVGEQLCEDGSCAEGQAVNWQIDFDACLHSFVCTLVTCLPDAICPPEEQADKSCCTTPSVPSCGCNFAVGE